MSDALRGEGMVSLGGCTGLVVSGLYLRALLAPRRFLSGVLASVWDGPASAEGVAAVIVGVVEAPAGTRWLVLFWRVSVVWGIGYCFPVSCFFGAGCFALGGASVWCEGADGVVGTGTGAGGAAAVVC